MILLKKKKKNYCDSLNIFPPPQDIYACFDKVHLNEVKVIILGQDPYHSKCQAMGLSFSVPKGVKIPPSLANIYKELNNELNISIPNHGDLSSWCEQGVLLLNTALTVS